MRQHWLRTENKKSHKLPHSPHTSTKYLNPTLAVLNCLRWNNLGDLPKQPCLPSLHSTREVIKHQWPAFGVLLQDNGWNKTKLGTCKKKIQSNTWSEVRQDKGIAGTGNKAFSYSLLFFLEKDEITLLFKSSEKNSERFLASQTEPWFLSMVSPDSSEQELQADQPDLCPCESSRVKWKLGVISLLICWQQWDLCSSIIKMTKGWTLDCIFSELYIYYPPIIVGCCWDTAWVDIYLLFLSVLHCSLEQKKQSIHNECIGRKS